MNNQNDSLKAVIDRSVHAAFVAAGYVLEDGSRDKTRVREQMFEILRPAKVLTKKEREAKAVTRGAMVEQVFPGLPGPAVFDDQENPQLAQAVWGEIDKLLWGMAATGATSMLQRLVGVNMGNGYVLCRTQVGTDRTSAVYITDNPECIELDFVVPANQKLDRTVRATVADREMLIYRQPQNARRYERRFSNTMKQLSAAASGQLALAVESAMENGTVPLADLVTEPDVAGAEE